MRERSFFRTERSLKVYDEHDAAMTFTPNRDLGKWMARSRVLALVVAKSFWEDTKDRNNLSTVMFTCGGGFASKLIRDEVEKWRLKNPDAREEKQDGETN